MTHQHRLRLLLAAALTVVPTQIHAVTCGDVFIGSSLVSAGVLPETVVLADVNGDPNLDIVALSAADGVSVLLGNGDGTFQAPILTPAEPNATSFVVGNFDADGDADVVVGFFGGGGVTLLGNGDGTFQPGIPFSSSARMFTMTAGDFDGDSALDVAGGAFGEVSVLLGNGNGTFGPSEDYSTDQNVNALAIGDLDGDDNVDLAMTEDETNVVTVLPGQGDGTLGLPVTIVAGLDLSALRIADLNADGKKDLVVASGGLVGVLLSKGNLAFQAAQDYAAGPYAIAAIPVDLDEDGFLDLAVSTVGADFPTPGALWVLRNQGDGTFVSSSGYGFVSNPTAPAAGDIDGDGDQDVVLGSATSDAVTPFINFGNGALAGVRLENVGSGRILALGDFNEDQFLDIVLGAAGIQIALGGPGATFAEQPNQPQIWGLAVAGAGDFDGDGHLDVVGTASPFSVPFAFVFFHGNGDGTFADPILLPIPGKATNGTGLLVRDLDGDGNLDAAFASSESSGFTGQVTVFLGDGQGGFANTAAMAVGDALFAGIAAADFDSDGTLDLASAGVESFPIDATVYVFLGRGDGTYDLPLVSDVGNLGPIAAGEFAQPGVSDIVLRVGSTTALLPGNDDGTFDPPVTIANLSATGLAVEDFDQDGLLDIVILDDVAESFVKGLASGNFDAPISYPASGAGSPVLVGDLDRNGSQDTVVGAGPLGIGILLNASLGATVDDSFAVVGSQASLAAYAGGTGLLAYQWRKGGVPLSDGGSISGSQTATLTIDPVSFADGGSYDVVVTDDCGSVTSNAASLSVEFADVPVSSPFHDDILAIATAGITSGCGGGNYCPTSPVRRDQMAVFLLKAEHGAPYTPPACSGVFADVPCPSAFADWIEQLAAEGVTGGCGGGNYCPGNSVTRAQMAVFLLKTSQGSGYTPPPATGIFGDVPVGSFAADFIEDLYNRGITGGCQTSPLLYCPNNAVLRQQMATFIVRTFFP